MDFAWSDEHLKIRERARRFLDDNLPADWESVASLSPGSEAVTRFSRAFCPKLAAAGLFAPHWPEEHGGEGASAWAPFLIGEVMWAAGEPRGPQYYNVNWLGPTIMKYGTAAQKAHHLGRMRAGDVVWCQGFSEPSGGSDLAALRTRAERRGDHYVVNGSKIWTSYARMAEYCFLLARARPEGRAISVYLLPMNREGVTVRPIDSVVGDGDLHEVFFDNVVAKEDELLGGEGEGWEIVRYALNFERVGIPRYALARKTLQRAVARLVAEGAFGEAAEQAAVSAHAACEAARFLVYEVVDERARAAPSTGATSMARIAVVAAEREVADFVLDWTPGLFTAADEPMVATHHKRAIAAGLAAGAAEIQLNLIARDVLGLGGRG
ncbi:MAG: acyl-CoA dehydrogenase family protein [Parvularculaceae bacterium]|nr:acyl-CoA dehydrogenase family protein [Parvularculaceae bacterium]